jgi:hypothetical protein
LVIRGFQASKKDGIAIEALAVESVDAAYNHKLQVFRSCLLAGVVGGLILSLVSLAARAMVGFGGMTAVGFLVGLVMAFTLRQRVFPLALLIVALAIGVACDKLVELTVSVYLMAWHLFDFPVGAVCIVLASLLVSSAIGLVALITMTHSEVNDYVERKLNLDLDGDGEIGHVLINANRTDAERMRGRVEYLKGIIMQFGQNTDWRSYDGLAPDFTRSDYEGLRDALITGGYAAWKNGRVHTAGWLLTTPAEEIVSTLDWERVV